MKNVILYLRISTDEDKQVYSLNHQESTLLRYCEQKGYNVLKIYREEHSAKNFNRPKFKELLSYVKSNRGQVALVLWTRWDRYSRNAHEAYNYLKFFTDVGVEINAVEQPLDLSNPDHKLMLGLYFVIPEMENDKISQRTMEGMRRAKKEGYWVSTPPFGFEMYKVDERHHSIRPNSNAAIVIKAFKEVGKCIESAEAIRKRLKGEGMKLSKQAFLNMLRNPVYIGHIKLAAYKNEPECIILGKFESIIEPELFYTVQDFLSERRRGNTKPVKRNENFPLRNFLQCLRCGENLTASQSKGRNGTRYKYYHCRKGCPTRIPAEDVNLFFLRMLSSCNVDDALMHTFSEILKDTFGENEKGRLARIRALGNEIAGIEDKLIVAQEKLLTDKISDESFNVMTERLNADKRKLNSEIIVLNNREVNPVNYLAMAKTVLASLDSLYNSVNYDLKRALVGSIFPEKIQISNEECRTSATNQVISYIEQHIRQFPVGKKNGFVKKDKPSPLALPLGLEPRTL